MAPVFQLRLELFECWQVAQPGDKKEISCFERKNRDQTEGEWRALTPQVSGDRAGSQILAFSDLSVASFARSRIGFGIIERMTWSDGHPAQGVLQNRNAPIQIRSMLFSIQCNRGMHESTCPARYRSV